MCSSDLKQVALVFNPLRNGNLVILKYGSCGNTEFVSALITVVDTDAIPIEPIFLDSGRTAETARGQFK